MSEIMQLKSFVGYDSHWQTPAITEKHSFDLLKTRIRCDQEGTYFAFPWASLIDGLNRESQLGAHLQRKLKSIAKQQIPGPVITVCQHIKFRDFIESFKEAGITDLYASHAMRGERVIEGINIHPFPLFPVQVPDENIWGNSTDRLLTDFLARRHLYSFMGAFNPDYYLTSSRKWIFELPDNDRGFIVNRNAWHFEHRVYQEQVYGETVCNTVLSEEERNARQFRDVLRKTQFSLCPSGTGPNSIRLWESIEFGCIPVILADELRLPGERRLWEEACVHVAEREDAVREIPELLARLVEDHSWVKCKLEALKTIRERYGRNGFVHDIIQRKPRCASLPAALPVPTGQEHRFYLSVQNVSDDVAEAWIDFLGHACAALKLPGFVYLDRHLSLESETVVGSTNRLPILAGDGAFPQPHNWACEDLVTVSDSQVLSAPLLKKFNRFHIRCLASPQGLSSSLIEPMEVHAQTMTIDLDAAPSGKKNDSRPAANWQPKCTLITSMYDGDEYIEGFLKNSAELSDYNEIEHLIVRPASPGREHTRLCQHVEQHPGAVYIWLHEDPRLYEVWNLCCRLSSSPYLSNANIDDRRSPYHVERLTHVLDENPDVQVASSALRITTIKNMEWESSTECEVWYASEPYEKYSGQHLFKYKDKEVFAYNAPHCMPVWRRSIHVWNGYFDEKRYGPSADWEFWLRAGSESAKFFILDEPLGLYLKSEDSYWRRSMMADQFDQRIAADWISYDGVLRPAGFSQSLSAQVSELQKSRHNGDWLRYFWCLFVLAQESLIRKPAFPALFELINRLCQRDLLIDIETLVNGLSDRPDRSGKPASKLSWIQRSIVDVLHLAMGPVPSDPRCFEKLSGALDQLANLNGSSDTLILRAFLAHRENETTSEGQLLSRAHSAGEPDFWPRLQTIYRFTRPLAELCADIPDLPAFTQLEEITSGQTVFFFPDYTHGNLYQKLLYEGLEQRGVRLVGVNDLTALTNETVPIKHGDVVHIHWINVLYKDAEAASYGEILKQFLVQLDQLKQNGLRIYWTVHNRYSHDLEDITLERDFRIQLCQRADRVLLHHPCLLEELTEWLPMDAPVRFLEHGLYIGSFENSLSKTEARQELALGSEDLIICFVGQVRPYKGLARVLPVIRKAMARNPKLKLILAGRVSCDTTRAELEKIPENRKIVRDEFIDGEDFQRYINAADYLLLCYQDILTSGTLFQSFSFGKPVIAPSLGSIPSYVIDGWNGYIYDDLANLAQILEMPELTRIGHSIALARNVHRTSETLSWPALPNQ